MPAPAHWLPARPGGGERARGGAPKLGEYVPGQAELAKAVQEWFAKPAEVREADVDRARAAGNPNAAFEIAGLLQRMVRD
jgi:hypothetical protein